MRDKRTPKDVCGEATFVGVNRSPKVGYGFRAGGKAICYSVNTLDRSQSPIFPCDRRDRARLTVNGGHLDF